MLGGHLSAKDIVGPHGAMRLSRRMSAPNDHRAIARRDFIQRFRLVGLADDDQPVDLARADILVEPVLILWNDAGQQQIIAALGQFIGEVAEHGDEERIGNVLAFFMAERDEDADGAGALGPQVAGEQIGFEAMFTRKSLEPFARLWANQRRIGQSARNGAGGDARQIGKLLHGLDLAHANSDYPSALFTFQGFWMQIKAKLDVTAAPRGA